MTEKKANHQVNIVRLGEPRVHTNADTLELFDVGGYQVVVRKEQFKAGDLAVYIQPDSVVPQTQPFSFIWATETDPAGLELVPERRRRITVRKFRKEWSEGLLMPIGDFLSLYPVDVFRKIQAGKHVGVVNSFVKEGDDVSDLLEITHYEGDSVETTQGLADSRPRRKYPKTLKGWFFYLLFKLGIKAARLQMNEALAFDVPKFDVENIKNFKHAIKPEDIVVITEKIHGSQGRYFFKEGKMYAGSRNFWKAENSPCVWRKALQQNPWIEKYCRENEGQVLYGEVVPTQKGYRYGCEEGETKFFVFDIRDENGDYLPKVSTMLMGGLNHVPLLYKGEYGAAEFTPEGVSSEISGGPKQIEGIVITVLDPKRWERGLGRVQVKQVANSFLEKDSK